MKFNRAQRRVIKGRIPYTPGPMTEIELLTEGWNCIQEARLKEMQEIATRIYAREHCALVEVLNADPFWEHIFDLLEKAIREVDPDHDYLPENHIQLD